MHQSSGITGAKVPDTRQEPRMSLWAKMAMEVSIPKEHHCFDWKMTA